MLQRYKAEQVDAKTVRILPGQYLCKYLHISHVGSLGKIDLLMAGGQVQAIYQLVGSTEARDQRLAWIAQFSWKAENISF